MSRRAWLEFAALCVIWDVPYFFIRIAVQDVPPLVVAWGRITLAALILLPIAWRRGALAAARPHLGAVCVFALVEFVVPLSAICIGERWIVIGFLGVAALMGLGLLHEHIGAVGLLALVVILAGSWLATRGARPEARKRNALTAAP